MCVARSIVRARSCTNCDSVAMRQTSRHKSPGKARSNQTNEPMHARKGSSGVCLCLKEKMSGASSRGRAKATTRAFFTCCCLFLFSSKNTTHTRAPNNNNVSLQNVGVVGPSAPRSQHQDPDVALRSGLHGAVEVRHRHASVHVQIPRQQRLIGFPNSVGGIRTERARIDWALVFG